MLILARKRQTTLCTYYNSEPACHTGLFVSQQTTLLSKLPQWISTIPRIPRISNMWCSTEETGFFLWIWTFICFSWHHFFSLLLFFFYFVWKKKLCIVCIFHNLDNCEMKGVFLTFLSPLPYEIQPSTRIRFHYFPSVKKKDPSYFIVRLPAH